jgi:DNA mismatch repair ATPase MutS
MSSICIAWAESRHWLLQVAAVTAELDALMSLARAAITGTQDGPMCRPCVTLDHPSGSGDQPFFSATALRHATAIQLSQAASFVPNDVDLGTEEPPFMLLTGPNTGGKSTLIRQVKFHLEKGHACWCFSGHGPACYAVALMRIKPLVHLLVSKVFRNVSLDEN